MYVCTCTELLHKTRLRCVVHASGSKCAQCVCVGGEVNTTYSTVTCRLSTDSKGDVIKAHAMAYIRRYLIVICNWQRLPWTKRLTTVHCCYVCDCSVSIKFRLKGNCTWTHGTRLLMVHTRIGGKFGEQYIWRNVLNYDTIVGFNCLNGQQYRRTYIAIDTLVGIMLTVRYGHPLSANILAANGQEIANTEDPYPVAVPNA